jgi:hypothetical protein
LGDVPGHLLTVCTTWRTCSSSKGLRNVDRTGAQQHRSFFDHPPARRQHNDLVGFQQTRILLDLLQHFSAPDLAMRSFRPRVGAGERVIWSRAHRIGQEESMLGYLRCRPMDVVVTLVMLASLAGPPPAFSSTLLPE